MGRGVLVRVGTGFSPVGEINEFLTESAIYNGDGDDVVTISAQAVRPRASTGWSSARSARSVQAPALQEVRARIATTGKSAGVDIQTDPNEHASGTKSRTMCE